MKKKNLLGGLVFIVCALLAPAMAFAAPTFTVSMPGTQSVTMRDPYQVLTFRVTNTGAEAINRVTFTFPGALYYVEWNTVPPNGWTFTTGTNSIRLNSSGGGFNIPAGGSLDFNILLKGPNWTAFVAANNDQTDTLTSITARGTSGTTRNATGALPTWLRRSLAITLVGYPDAVGIGQTFSLGLQVENRSTSPKNNIAVIPSPPTPTYSGGAAVANTGGPAPASLNLGAGAQGTISYTYQATTEGTVYFSASAATAQATSKDDDSNVIVINSLAVSLSVTPLTVVSGQNVTVSMSVQNTGRTTTLSAAIDNAVTTIPVASTAGFPPSGTIIIEAEQLAYTGTNVTSFVGCTRGINGTTAAAHASTTPVRSTAAFGSVVPSLAALGTAVISLISGPTPTEIASLSPAQNAQFIWVYRITGAVGQTYQFQGSATANGSLTSNTALSQQGTISNYSVTVSPSSVAVGSTNVTLSFTFYNGTAGVSIRSINHNFPDATWTGYQSATVTCSDGNNNWTVTGGGQTFTSQNNASRIDNGQSCTFNLVFSAIPNVTNDRTYAFYSDLYDQNSTYVTTLQSNVIITANSLILIHAPAGPLNADGTSAYTMTATMTAGGLPLVGANVVFAATAGTLSAGNVVTNAAGQAVVTLLAPVSSTNITAVVTATYFKTTASDTVQFTGVNAPNLQYVGGSLAPLAVCAGSNYSFTLQVKNYGTAAMNLTTGSDFTFTDGTRTYSAYLDAASSVGVNAVVTLVFGSPTNAGGGGGMLINNAFTPGAYTPVLNFIGTVNQTRTVFDKVTVENCTPVAGSGKIRMIKWREVFP